MRLDLLLFLTVSVYYQAIARPDITPEIPFFIHSSSAELRRRAELSSRASPEDVTVALDTPVAAVSDSPFDVSSPSQPTVPFGQQETDLSAAGSTDRVSLTGSDNGCSPSSGHKFRKRQSCAGKSKDDSAHNDVDLDPTNSPTEPESGCSPSSGSKLRKRQYCRWSSGSDEPLDDSNSDDEKRFCPRNRKTLCCKGPRPSGIYTQGCSDCKYLLLPSAPIPPWRPPPQASPSPIPSFKNKIWNMLGGRGSKTEE